MNTERKNVEKLITARDAMTVKAAQNRTEVAKLQAEIEAALTGDTFNDAAAALVTTKRARAEHLATVATRLDADAAAYAPQIDEAVGKWKLATLDAIREEQKQISAEVATLFRRWMPAADAAATADAAGPVQWLEGIASEIIYGGAGITVTEQYLKRLIEMCDRKKATGSFMPPLTNSTDKAS